MGCRTRVARCFRSLADYWKGCWLKGGKSGERERERKRERENERVRGGRKGWKKKIRSK
jgi:hypothetical protein